MNDRLEGWKGIAAHLRRSVRTAQRWERELGLPVHRMQAETGESVYALAAELDAWVRQRERGPRAARPASPPGAAPTDAGPLRPLAPYAGVPHLVPSIFVPVSPAQRLLPWFAGGGILLTGTLIGWLLARF